MREPTPETQIAEIRRFTFRSLCDLRSKLQDIPTEALPGGFYRVVASDYVRALKKLGAVPGFSLTTAQDIYDRLEPLEYKMARGSPRWRVVQDPEQWTYLSPVARRWRRCMARDNRILVRAGWALCFHGAPGRRQYYVVDEAQPLESCAVRGDWAIHQGYEGAFGTLPVPVWQSSQFLYAIWPGYVIPKAYQDFLMHTLSPLDEPLASDDGERVWVWHQSDRSWVEHVLRTLRLRLEPWSAEKSTVQTASLIVRRAYGGYFKRRGSGLILQSLITQRAWEQIEAEDRSLGQTIRQLCQAEWNGDSGATMLLDYTAQQLCAELQWQQYGDPLEAWVIESSPIVYGEEDTGQRYYRMAVPDHGLVLGWPTRRQPEWEGTRLPRVRVFHWRSMPYAGRLKTAPRSPAPEVGEASRRLRDNALRTLLGLPSVEWQLAKTMAIDAFMLDLDGSHWRGCHDLGRYFYGYGRVIALNPVECDGFGLLLEDILGNRFVLETHAIRRENLLPAGDWVRFVAHSSLLAHTSSLAIGRDMPVFEAKLPQYFQRAYEKDALSQSIMAVVKYHYGMDREQLGRFLAAKVTDECVARLVAELLDQGELAEYKRRLYFRYTALNPSRMLELLRCESDGTDPLPYYAVRTLLHPLHVRATHLRAGEACAPSHIGAQEHRVFISREQTLSDLQAEAQRHLEAGSSVRILARGAQVQRAQELIRHVSGALPDVRISRCDSTCAFENGTTAAEVVYLVCHPLSLLKHHFQ